MAKNANVKFDVIQLITSEQFTIKEKDILKAITKDEKLTVSEAKKKIENFLKRKVK